MRGGSRLVALLILSLTFSSFSHYAGLKKLPKWWDGKVFEVRGTDMLVAGRFNENYDLAGQALEYEVALERVSDKKGIIWGRQFVQRSKFKSRANGFTTKLRDGFVQIDKRSVISWMAVSEQQDRLIIEEKKLYEIDLSAGYVTDLNDDRILKLSVESKKINRVRTYVIKVEGKTLSLEDYGDKLRLITPTSTKRGAMILVQDRDFEAMNEESWDIQASKQEQAKGDQLFAKGQFRLALNAYDLAIEKNKWNIEAWSGRGYTYHHLKNYTEAEAHYTFKTKFGKEGARDLLYQGNTAYEQQEYREAIKRYRLSIDLNEANGEAHHKMGLSMRALNEKDMNQCTSFKRAAALDSESYSFALTSYCTFSEKALDSMMEPFYDKGTENKEEVLMQALDYVDFHQKLASESGSGFDFDVNELKLLLASHFLANKTQLPRSIGLYEEVLASRKYDRKVRARMWYEMALAYRADKKTGKAIEFFKKVVNSQGNGWEQFERMSLFHLVVLYKDDLNQYEEAMRYVNKLIAVTIKYNTFVDDFRYGKVYGVVNLYREDLSEKLPALVDRTHDAISQQYIYSSTISKEKRAAVWPLRMKAQINLFRKRYEEAIEDARLAAQLDPQHRQTCHYFMGVAHYGLLNSKESIRYLELAKQEGYEIKVENGSYEYMLGKSYTKLGQLSQGCNLLVTSQKKGDKDASDLLTKYCYKSKSWTWKLTSGLGASNTEIYVRKGDLVSIEASGKMRFGTFAGSGGPKGVNGFAMYNKVSGAKHGALLFRIGSSGDWYIAGTSRTITANKEGYLRLLINDKDPSNNVGRFEGRIIIKTPVY